MRRLRHGRPIWLDRRPPTRRFPQHKGQLDVDVVIVGGGITGAICSYLFAGAGASVALVEAAKVGCGSTVASTALLMQEPDRDLGDLRRRFGGPAAVAIWRALRRATRELVAALGRLKVAGLSQCDSVYFTRDAAKVAVLRREFRTRKAAGLPGLWLSSRALYQRTGIRAKAAILTRGNAQVNPFVACHAFLEAAGARGAKVFERSRARRIAASGGGVTVETAKGTIRARVVVVATGYATPDLRGRLGRFRMKDTYVIAMPRRSSSSLRDPSRSKTMAWDTDRPYHYLRWTEDGRLLVGGEDTRHRGVKGARGRLLRAQQRLVDYLRETCPDLTEESPEYAWQGLFAETPDGLPFIGQHSRFPRHLFALGYGGNGMTASFLAGMLLLDLYRSRSGAAKARKIIKLFAFRRGHG